MKTRNFSALCALLLALGVFWTAPALADKAAATIEAPAEAAKGSEVAIRITVTHNGNSDRHHVEWAKILVNGKEIAKWEYSPSKLPEGVPFTREVKIKAEGNLEVKAEASCNLHGGRSPSAVKISVK